MSRYFLAFLAEGGNQRRRSPSLSLGSLPRSLGARSSAAWVGGRAGLAACPLQYIASLACPRLRRGQLPKGVACSGFYFATLSIRFLRSPLLSAVLPFGFAQIGVLGAYPPSAYSPACARQFGYAFGQKPAHLVIDALFPAPPETRKVVGCASFPSFSRSVSTDYRLLTFYVKRFVLADKVYAFASNFLFVDYLKKKIRTDKLFSLHSFITVT
ncbi:MAG: hypothetical protein KJ711_01695 [Candidatus Omnitrophica bacterium]|nr:hypothetical protein [Candidatus Omnitrophota bacterium]MBU1524660.1 hypothetical protein [Candidatus Omnitrophota bacterium]